MLLARSRPTNPNWQGLKAWGTFSSPVEQAFHNTYQGTAGLSAGAEALPQAVWSVLQTLQPLFLCCLNTED